MAMDTTYKTNNRPRCQLCDKPGHIAKVCRSQSHNHMEEKAHFASRGQQSGAPWIVDFGASHHIASNTNNFSEVQAYIGPKEIVMGYGNMVPISQTGTVQINGAKAEFLLSDTLCAPNNKHNFDV